MLVPSAEIKIDKTFYDVATFSRESLKFAPLLSFKDWDVQRTQAVSPLARFLHAGRKEVAGPSVLCQPIGKVTGPLEVAATAAFFDMGIAVLRRVIKEEYEDAMRVVPIFPKPLRRWLSTLF